MNSDSGWASSIQYGVSIVLMQAPFCDYYFIVHNTGLDLFLEAKGLPVAWKSHYLGRFNYDFYFPFSH